MCQVEPRLPPPPWRRTVWVGNCSDARDGPRALVQKLGPDLVIVDNFPQHLIQEEAANRHYFQLQERTNQRARQEVYAPGQTSVAASNQRRTPTCVCFLLLVQLVWPPKLGSWSKNPTQSSLVTTQNMFAVLKASLGLILKSKSGKQLNFISLEMFLGQS